jgi:hypothetical protein
MSQQSMYVTPIDNALKKIDFEIPDDDRTNFYTFVFKKKWNIEMNYDVREYRPPKYFNFLLKLIDEHL